MKDGYVLLDEFHLEMYVPKHVLDCEVRGIRDGLASELFRSELRRAVRRLLRKEPIFFNVKLNVMR